MLKINIIFILILANIFIYVLTEVDKNNKINRVLNDYKKRTETTYKNVTYNEIKTSDILVKYIQKNSIDILSKAKNATKNDKAILRKELYDKIYDRYLQVKARWGIYQLQFTLPDNKVFLRMHKPEKFGDDIGKIRYSIRYVNKHKKILRGLEGGKITHAIRNIYPLFDKNGVYLGLVEISFTTLFIQDFFKNLNNLHTHILIHKENFKNEIWDEENVKLKYNTSTEHNDYNILLSDIHTKDICVINNSEKIKPIKSDIKYNISKGKAFSTYIKHNGNSFNYHTNKNHVDIISFIPILNTKNNTTGWIVSYEIDQNISDIVFYTNTFRIIILIMLSIIFYFLYKTINQKNILKEKVKEQTAELQNSLSNVKSQQSFIETLMDNSPLPIFYKNINGVYLGVNKEFENVFGYDKEQIIGKSIYDIVPKEIADECHKQDLEVFNNPDLKQEYSNIIKNIKTSEEFNVYFHKKAFLDKNRKVKGLIGAVVDVTKQKRYEKEITEQSAKLFELNIFLEDKVKERTKDLQNAQRLAKLGTWELDIQTHILKWCDEAYKIFEVDKKETLYFKDFLNLIHIDDGLKFFDSYNNKHLIEHGAYVLVHRITTKKGHTKYIEERCETIYDKNNNPILSRGTVQDITEQKIIEIELKEKTDQMIKQAKLAQMGELLSMIAHQWRQPLGSISSAVISIKNKLLLNKFDLSKETERNNFLEFLDKKLNNISNYNEFLSKTIDDFRNFYKEDKETSNILLSDSVKNALNIIDSSLKNNNIKVNTQFNDKNTIDVYQSEIIQVLLNILKNSEDNFIEKNIENRTIDIVTQEENDNISIFIKDNGGGIENKIIKDIFEPYFSTKDLRNGTGLGLYMSKQIIEDHHKGILNAVNKDDGVEFKITIKRK